MELRSLMNRTRAQQVCARMGVDALVLAEPVNVYHATGFWPKTSAMGQLGMSLAVVPADPSAKAALVTSHFLYYFLDAGSAQPHDQLDVRLYTAPAGDEAAPPSYFSPAGEGTPDPFDRATRDATDAMLSRHAPYATSSDALRDVVGGMARLAVDGFMPESLLGPGHSYVPAEPLLRHIRMIKTPAEIELVRIAARSNERAARAAIGAMSIGDSYEDLRRAFFSAVGQAGGTPDFISIDSNAYAGRDGQIREGRCFSIDAVSKFSHYNGDFGRTVVVGEPHPALMRAIEAAHAANLAVAERLGPGLRYSDVMQFGRDEIAARGVDAFSPSAPHSVGLFHTDEAFENDSLTFAKADHLIEPGMVLSVDLPVLQTDIGGTVHLEDMWLITQNGCEALNDAGDAYIRL